MEKRIICLRLENQFPWCIHSQNIPGNPKQNQLANAAATTPRRSLNTGMDWDTTIPSPQIPRVMRSQAMVESLVLLMACFVWPKMRVKTYWDATWV